MHTHVSPRVAQHASAWTTRWPAHISTRACSSSHVDGTDEILQRVKVGRRRCWSAQSNADTPDQLAGVQAPVPRTHTVPAVTKTVEPELQPRCAATWGVHGSASGGCMAAPGGAFLSSNTRNACARTLHRYIICIAPSKAIQRECRPLQRTACPGPGCLGPTPHFEFIIEF